VCGGVSNVIWRKKSTDLLLYCEKFLKLDHVTSKEETTSLKRYTPKKIEVFIHLSPKIVEKVKV
jgi:hypothetical protein